MKPRAVPAGPWIQTATGRAFPLLDPGPQDIDIRDIAGALAKLCRYTGHTNQFYSVAQHSVLVASQLPARLHIYGLLHDAHEAYLGDWSTPLKEAMALMSIPGALRSLQLGLDIAIHKAFHLSWPLLPEQAALIKQADLRALATERRDLLDHEIPWGIALPDPLPQRVRPQAWAAAEESFMGAFLRATQARAARLAAAS